MTNYRDELKKHQFECDSCGDSLYTETVDFMRAVENLKVEGWRTVKSQHGWEHFCPICQKENPQVGLS